VDRDHPGQVEVLGGLGALTAVHRDGEVERQPPTGRKTSPAVVGLTLGGTIAFYTFTTYMQKFMIKQPRAGHACGSSSASKKVVTLT